MATDSAATGQARAPQRGRAWRTARWGLTRSAGSNELPLSDDSSRSSSAPEEEDVAQGYGGLLAMGPSWTLMPMRRRSYRVGARSPSPTYTSDSDETLEHKCRYHMLSAWVGRRWLARVHFARRRQAREQRRVACLVVLQAAGFFVPVARLVLAFLPGASQVPFRRLPRYNRWGILVSPREVVVPARPGIVDPWDEDSSRSSSLTGLGLGAWAPDSDGPWPT